MNYNSYFPIVEYYKKVVEPLNPERYKVKSDKMFVCPLHDDHDPSLGLIKSKKGDMVHCFGCGFWGDIIKFHKTVSRRQLKKVISDEEALKELCNIFKKDYNSVPKSSSLGVTADSGASKELAVDDAIEDFDIGDFQKLMFDGKREKKPIGYFNAVVMTMVDAVKKEEEE